jgi:hypothetical protein
MSYLISQLISKNGEILVNVPAEPHILSEMGFDADEAVKLCSDAIQKAKWEQIREMRNALISGTDWTQMPDTVINSSLKSAFISYRQSLRDIPQNFSDPDSVIWPEEPTNE